MNPETRAQLKHERSRNPLARGVAALGGLARALWADRRGNIMMMTGLAIIPLTFAIGFGVDYSRAEKLQTRLNAAADAAALAAVDPSMILQTDATAKATAQAMFNAQSSSLSGVTNLQSTITVTDVADSALGSLRKVTVTYTASSTNEFGGILHVPTLPISGSSTANAQQPPNVNFYVAMDVSPSMLLPATSSGLTNEATATSAHVNSPSGCDFACHEKIPHNDNIYINDTSGRQVLLSSGFYGSGSTQYTYYLYNTSTSTLYNSTGAAMNSSTSNTTTGTATVTTGNPSTSTSTSGGVTTTTTTQTTTTSTPTTTTTVATTYSIVDSNSGPVTITQNVATTTQTTTASTPVTTKTVTKSNQSGSTVTTSTGSTTTTTGNPATTTTSATYDTGYWADGYWLTHNYGQIYGSPSSLTLRVDNEVAAVQQLVPYASNQATTYKVTYQMQLYSFDWTHPGASSPVTQLTTMQNVGSMSGVNVANLMPATDYWWQNSEPTSSTNIDDQGTETGNMLTYMTNTMPTAGNGSATSTPQEILFIVTDGMVDENEGGRTHGPFTGADLTKCTAIKNKGIKIAILYTQYLPQALVGDSWSQANVAPYLPAPPSPYVASGAGSSDQDLTALQSCASPGATGTPLVQTVSTDGDFTAALQNLFSTALQTARLVQ